MPPRRRDRDRITTAAATVVAVSLTVAACTQGAGRNGATVNGTPASPRTTTPAATPTDRPNLSRVAVEAVRIATLDSPTALAVAPGSDDLYIAQQGGVVAAIRSGRVDRRPVLDLSSEVSTGTEQGLLGLAFAPDGGFLYVNFTDRSGDTRVREYRFAGGRAVRRSAREVLTVDQPFANHNGGQLTFGRDRLLYIALGDGGSGGDPEGNAQSLGTLLGKILRIDPRRSGRRPYRVPADNPFVGRSGARGEIWAYGLRNPWRFSFDRATGDLWIGDVGQFRWEEIDFAPASSRGGENYGWDRLEGRHRFEGRAPRDHVPPVFEYASSGEACSVIGGFVYRGTAIAPLRGAYLFSDFCSGTVRALVTERGKVTDERSLDVTVPRVSSFGEDAQGEIYVLSLAGGIFRLEPR